MSKMKEAPVYYYSNELEDEFSKAKIVPRKIDENYKYEKNKLWNILSYIIQNVLSMPIKIIYAKVKFRIKFIGKENLKNYKNQGYFIYVNHTQTFADTFIPSLANYPKRNFFIVNPENISIKGTGKLIEMLGAIPVPESKNASKKFLKEIELRIKNKNSITIYPEAHIWPYYTKIRNFKSVSFKYPVNLNVPTFCLTNTYQKYKKDKIQIVSYIDGPFYADNLKTKKEKVENLRNKVYNCMVERSKNNNIEHIKYVYKEK